MIFQDLTILNVTLNAGAKSNWVHLISFCDHNNQPNSTCSHSRDYIWAIVEVPEAIILTTGCCWSDRWQREKNHWQKFWIFQYLSREVYAASQKNSQNSSNSDWKASFSEFWKNLLLWNFPHKSCWSVFNQISQKWIKVAEKWL